MVEPTKDKQPENEIADVKQPEAAPEKPNFAANKTATEPEAEEEEK